MIRDKIVFSINDEHVKERLLREFDLSLARALDVCRAAETTRAQLKVMCLKESQVGHSMSIQQIF